MQVPKLLRWLSRSIVYTSFIPLCFVTIEASAACSDSKVKRLSGRGETVASISRTCDMEVDEVRSILEEDDSDQRSDPQSHGGLAPGTPLAQCACWGPVAQGVRYPQPACRSGYAVPRLCPVMCPAGGYAWQGVCGQ